MSAVRPAQFPLSSEFTARPETGSRTTRREVEMTRKHTANLRPKLVVKGKGK
ncbi:hypothetical protein GCM10009660_01490 [Catellatospora bangladeshensis]